MEMDSTSQLDFSFSPVITRTADGSYLVKPGRPVAGRMLRVKEVAEKLQVTCEHVAGLIESGLLQAVDIGNGRRRHWRIPVTALDDFLAKRHSLKNP